MNGARAFSVRGASALIGLGACVDPGGGGGEIGIYDATAGDDGLQLEDAGATLVAHLQVTGNGARCGACVTLLAEASGGTAPYRYAWSDPSLVGPGPHSVCPHAPSSYAVAISSAEGSGAPGTVVATASLTCAPDAGPPALTVLDGCKVLPPETGDDHLSCPTDAGAPDDGGPLAEAHSDRITFLVTPGQTYEYLYDMVVPVGLGADSTVDVYGARAPCGLDEKMFTITLASIPHQAFCFTPSFKYVYSTALVRVKGIPFSFGTTPTVCSTCAPDAGAAP